MGGIDPGASNAQLWAMLIALFMPTVVSVVQQPKWSDATRSLVQMAISLVVSAVTVAFEGGFSGGDIARTFLIVFLLSQVSYTQFWKRSGITTRLEALTSPGGSVVSVAAGTKATDVVAVAGVPVEGGPVVEADPGLVLRAEPANPDAVPRRPVG